MVFQTIWKTYTNFEFLSVNLNSFWLNSMTDFIRNQAGIFFLITVLRITVFILLLYLLRIKFFEDPVGKKSLISDFHRLSSKANVFLQCLHCMFVFEIKFIQLKQFEKKDWLYDTIGVTILEMERINNYSSIVQGRQSLLPLSNW